MRLTKEELFPVIARTEAAPFLFIGSGLSRRYLDLEDWTGLLRHFASLANSKNWDFPYETYRQLASSMQKDADVPDLAYVGSAIESAYNTDWFTSPVFAEQREAFKKIIMPDVSPFRLAVSEHVKSKNISDESSVQCEIELLIKLSQRNIAGVITTNYDQLVNKLFTGFRVFVGQEELLLEHSEGLGEIYKIHGCCKQPGSLILTAEDYVQFNKKNAYLAAKLLTLFWENPVIFLGYSISDPNIQSILGMFAEFLTEDKLTELGQRLIVVEWNNTDGDDQIGAYTKGFGSKSIPMTRIYLKDYSTLYEALLEHRPIHRYHTTVLRRLRDDIYGLVLSNEPSDTVLVNDGLDPNTPADELEKVKFVIGVGVKHLGEVGYIGMPSNMVYEDVLRGIHGSHFDPTMTVKHTLPTLAKQNGGGGPAFMYLRQIPELNLSELAEAFRTEVERRLTTGFDAFYHKGFREKRNRFPGKTIEDLRDIYSDLLKCCYQCCYLPEEAVDVDELERLLKDTLGSHKGILEGDCKAEWKNYQTDIRRLIKVYDWMKYGRDLSFKE